MVSILETSACMYGPGTVYLFKYGLNATVWMRVLGRNEDGSWLLIRAGNDQDSNACWIKATLVKFLSGRSKMSGLLDRSALFDPVPASDTDQSKPRGERSHHLLDARLHDRG